MKNEPNREGTLLEQAGNHGRIRQPQQNPASLAVYGEPHLSGHDKTSPTNAPTQRTPHACEIPRQVANRLSRHHGNSVRVIRVTRLRSKREPVATDLRHMPLSIARPLHSDINVATLDPQIPAHAHDSTSERSEFATPITCRQALAEGGDAA